jgi:hypothetical protein
MIDKSLAKPRGPACCIEGEEFGSSPMPKILDWKFEPGAPAGTPPSFWHNYDEGTRYICETCGTVYVCTWADGYIVGSVAVSPRWEWRRETRWQRLVRRIRTRKTPVDPNPVIS